MNLGTTRLRGRPRNIWQEEEVREDGRLVGGEGWQKKVHNREEWKKFLRTGKESLHSVHANGMNELLYTYSFRAPQEIVIILLIPQKLSWLLATDGRISGSTVMLWYLVT